MVMTEPKDKKGPGLAPGPNPVFSQNGASSRSCADTLAGTAGPCSFRFEPAHDISADGPGRDLWSRTFSLPFGCS